MRHYIRTALLAIALAIATLMPAPAAHAWPISVPDGTCNVHYNKIDRYKQTPGGLLTRVVVFRVRVCYNVRNEVTGIRVKRYAGEWTFLASA